MSARAPPVPIDGSLRASLGCVGTHRHQGVGGVGQAVEVHRPRHDGHRRHGQDRRGRSDHRPEGHEWNEPGQADEGACQPERPRPADVA